MNPKPFLLAAVLMAVPALVIAQESAQSAFKASHDKMMHDMMKPMSGDADKDFVMMMIPHHQGAIEMAKIQLKFGKDPMLRAMAEEIVKAQEKEIAEMKKWQASHP